MCNLLACAVQVIRGSCGLSLTFCCPLCWKGVRHFCSDGLSSGPLVWAASLASLAGVVASVLLRVGLEVVAEAASFICQVQTYPSVGCILAGQAASCLRGSKRGAGMGRSAGSGILLSPSFRDLAVISQCPDGGLRTEGTELLLSCCRAGSSQILAAQVTCPSSSTAWVPSVPMSQARGAFVLS